MFFLPHDLAYNYFQPRETVPSNAYRMLVCILRLSCANYPWQVLIAVLCSDALCFSFVLNHLLSEDAAPSRLSLMLPSIIFQKLWGYEGMLPLHPGHATELDPLRRKRLSLFCPLRARIFAGCY